jgi:hypothetical protein
MKKSTIIYICLYSPVDKYFGTCLKIRIWIILWRKNSSQNEGLSPSCIAISFDWFGWNSWHSMGGSALIQFSQFFFRISNFYGLSTTEET